MKTQAIYSAILFLSLNTSVFAMAPCESVAKDAVMGTACKTSEGYVFKRFQSPASALTGWEDAGLKGHGGVGGKIWYDAHEANVDAQDALNFCAARQLEVPSAEDYKIGLKHGLKEVLKDNPSDLFWTTNREQSRPLGLFMDQVVFSGPVHTTLITYPYFSSATLGRILNVRCNGKSAINTP